MCLPVHHSPPTSPKIKSHSFSSASSSGVSSGESTPPLEPHGRRKRRASATTPASNELPPGRVVTSKSRSIPPASLRCPAPESSRRKSPKKHGSSKPSGSGSIAAVAGGGSSSSVGGSPSRRASSSKRAGSRDAKDSKSAKGPRLGETPKLAPAVHSSPSKSSRRASSAAAGSSSPSKKTVEVASSAKSTPSSSPKIKQPAPPSPKKDQGKESTIKPAKDMERRRVIAAGATLEGGGAVAALLIIQQPDNCNARRGCTSSSTSRQGDTVAHEGGRTGSGDAGSKDVSAPIGLGITTGGLPTGVALKHKVGEPQEEKPVVAGTTATATATTAIASTSITPSIPAPAIKAVTPSSPPKSALSPQSPSASAVTKAANATIALPLPPQTSPPIPQTFPEGEYPAGFVPIDQIAGHAAAESTPPSASFYPAMVNLVYPKPPTNRGQIPSTNTPNLTYARIQQTQNVSGTGIPGHLQQPSAPAPAQRPPLYRQIAYRPNGNSASSSEASLITVSSASSRSSLNPDVPETSDRQPSNYRLPPKKEQKNVNLPASPIKPDTTTKPKKSGPWEGMPGADPYLGAYYRAAAAEKKRKEREKAEQGIKNAEKATETQADATNTAYHRYTETEMKKASTKTPRQSNAKPDAGSEFGNGAGAGNWIDPNVEAYYRRAEAEKHKKAAKENKKHEETGDNSERALKLYGARSTTEEAKEDLPNGKMGGRSVYMSTIRRNPSTTFEPGLPPAPTPPPGSAEAKGNQSEGEGSEGWFKARAGGRAGRVTEYWVNASQTTLGAGLEPDDMGVGAAPGPAPPPAPTPPPSRGATPMKHAKGNFYAGTPYPRPHGR